MVRRNKVCIDADVYQMKTDLVEFQLSVSMLFKNEQVGHDQNLGSVQKGIQLILLFSE